MAIGSLYVKGIILRRDKMKLKKRYRDNLARERMKSRASILYQVEKDLKGKRGQEISDYISSQRDRIRRKLSDMDREG